MIRQERICQMGYKALIRTAAIAAIVALAPAWHGSLRAAELGADERLPIPQVAASDAGSTFVPLGVGKSVVIDLPGDVKDVLVADPKIANAVIRSARRAYLIGIARGQTSVYFFDAQGRQLAGFDIAVTRDLNGLRAVLRRMFPNADLQVEGLGDGVVVSGTMSSPVEAQQAYDVAKQAVGGSGSVINGIAVKGRDQVMLKVTVAEVQRDVVKQLGIDLAGKVGQGSAVLDFVTDNPFSAFGQALSGSAFQGTFGTNNKTQVLIKAMERAGVIRTLAEPTLSAISGESATFLAGGQFPIPSGLSCDTTKSPPLCQASIEFKNFGVSMNFTPVVLSEGRISLKVMTEVSDLSSDNALPLSVPGAANVTIPSIRVRRADTTVEIPSGGALAMAGMIQEQTKQAINGIPGLQQVPVLGALFRSRDYVNNQTELMIIVTPYIVHAVAQKDLARPDDGFADVSDPSQILLGRLNKIYGVNGRADPNRTYNGRFGFIMD
jgi:pilus assembly protein CpaC